MSNISNTDAVVTESKLKDFYEDIKPFLGCPAYLTSEGTSDYYSTDEKVIGRWIDGKPLYQKTVKNTTLKSIPNNAWTTYCALDNPYELISFSLGRITSNRVLDVMTDVSGGLYNGSNLQVIARGQTLSCEYGTIATFRYTKSTDSAATTIQEDPNEYSTDEKIIGKWIDGKPLYQKTFQFDNMTIDGTQQIFGSLSELNIGSYAEVVRSTLNEDNYWTNPGILCVWVRVPQNNFGVRMVDGVSRHGSLYFTIQYTKTTD